MIDILLLALGLMLVVAGAEHLLTGILGLARRLRISAFALMVVVSGFELENLAAGIAANAKGLGGAAAGTFLGGTTFLALGVAGLGAMLAPISADLDRRVLGWTAAAPVPLLLLSIDRTLTRLDGAVLLAWFALVIVATARSQPEIVTEELQRPHRSPLMRLLAGIGLLSLGGEVLGDGLRKVVARFGVSETLLGNTAIAASVEAEEVGRVAVPSRRGRGDLALANIAGTIIHFVAFNAGVIALVRPIALDHATLALHLPATVASTLAFTVAVARGQGLTRAAGAGLSGLYVTYVAIAVVSAL